MRQLDDFDSSGSIRRNIKLINQRFDPCERIALTFNHQAVRSFAGHDADPIGTLSAFTDLIGRELFEQFNHVFNPGFFEVDNGNFKTVGDVDPINDFNQAVNVGGMIANDQHIGLA